LLLGKTAGITLFAWIAVRAGIAALPAGVGWRMVYGSSWLGAIGFTMALFVAGLAFAGSPMLETAKAGILAASACGRTHRVRGAPPWLTQVPVPPSQRRKRDVRSQRASG
jgi:Na+/H+ antiporter NhaA